MWLYPDRADDRNVLPAGNHLVAWLPFPTVVDVVGFGPYRASSLQVCSTNRSVTRETDGTPDARGPGAAVSRRQRGAIYGETQGWAGLGHDGSGSVAGAHYRHGGGGGGRRRRRQGPVVRAQSSPALVGPECQGSAATTTRIRRYRVQDQPLLIRQGSGVVLHHLVRPLGFEPRTCGLRVRCSAVELEAQGPQTSRAPSRGRASVIGAVEGDRRGSNPRPPGPHPGALPTELRPPRSL